MLTFFLVLFGFTIFTTLTFCFFYRKYTIVIISVSSSLHLILGVFIICAIVTRPNPFLTVDGKLLVDALVSAQSYGESVTGIDFQGLPADSEGLGSYVICATSNSVGDHMFRLLMSFGMDADVEREYHLCPDFLNAMQDYFNSGASMINQHIWLSNLKDPKAVERFKNLLQKKMEADELAREQAKKQKILKQSPLALMEADMLNCEQSNSLPDKKAIST